MTFDHHAYQAAWRAANAARLRAYREAHREEKRAYDRAYNANPVNKQLSGAMKRKIYGYTQGKARCGHYHGNEVEKRSAYRPAQLR
jgi:hypothetical protein